MSQVSQDTKVIRTLNDVFRETFIGGRVMLTPGITALSPNEQARIIEAVQAFDGFNADNDPWEEHDFGSIVVENTRYFWKIDYYDRSCQQASADPADPDKTTRVLTIMRGDEY